MPSQLRRCSRATAPNAYGRGRGASSRSTGTPQLLTGARVDVMVIAVVQLCLQARISLAFGTIANQDCGVCTAHFVSRGGCAFVKSNSSGSPAMLDKLVTASCWHCRKAATVACSTAVCGCQNGGGCVESHSSSRRRRAQASQFHCVCTRGFTGPRCSTSTTTGIKLSGGNEENPHNLKACTGECDTDDQCAQGLKCFQRQHGEPIPGCYGAGGGADWDYCYQPSTHDSIVGIWYNTPEVRSPRILAGTNAVLIFQPKFTPSRTFTVAKPIAVYKTSHPSTKVYATIGSGVDGITKSNVRALIKSTLQRDLDGLVLEIEVFGTGANTHGWEALDELIADLQALRGSFKRRGKQLIVTTGGSGFTAELGCSLPGSTALCKASGPLGGADLKNLRRFLQKLAAIDWDLWTPQIYDLHMHESWAKWQASGYAMWTGFDAHKIAFSVGQGVGSSVPSMQKQLRRWLKLSNVFPSALEELPIVGYPYTTGRRRH